jgi:steroid delta-isomerase-like uncharacterized protein
MSELQNQMIVEKMLKAVTSLDPEAASLFYAEDVVFDVPGQGYYEGRDAVHAFEGGIYERSKTYYVNVHQMLASGDDVIVHYTHGGTLKADEDGIPSTGEDWEMRGTAWITFRDGKIIKMIDVMVTTK